LASGSCCGRGELKSGENTDRCVEGLVPLVALSWLATVLLVITGLIGANVELLLWPAAALHLILADLLT